MEAVPLFRICLKFSKFGGARYLSALDLSHALESSLRRARLPLAYSPGFHPRPRIKFEDALPLGWSSDCERCWIELTVPYPSREAELRLSRCLPGGIELLACFPHPGKPAAVSFKAFEVNGMPEGSEAQQLPVGVSCRHQENGTLRFELDFTCGQKIPSMKKLLRSLCEDHFAQLAVRRLDVAEVTHG